MSKIESASRATVLVCITCRSAADPTDARAAVPSSQAGRLSRGPQPFQGPRGVG